MLREEREKEKQELFLNSVLYNVTSYPTKTAVQKTYFGIILFLAFTACYSLNFIL